MSAPTMPPRMGPLMRSQLIGGPACSTVSRVMPGTTSIAGRTSTRIWWAASTRSMATRFAASTSSRQSEASASASSGGRQSTRRTGTPCATSADAKSSGPTTTASGGLSSKPRSGAMAAPRKRPRRLGGDSIARAHDRTQIAERLLLLLETLRILVGPDHVSHDRQRSSPAPRSRLVERRAERASRVGMRTVSENQVEQDHGDIRVVSRLDERGVAAPGIDDRMRPSPRELLAAVIGESVLHASDYALRLVTQRPAAIESANRAARAGCCCRWPWERRDVATGETDRGDGRLLQ